MREFTIRLRSVHEVRDFVNLATKMGFPVTVCDTRHRVNGYSFMEMFCLDCTQRLTVTAECTDAEFESFRAEAQSFTVD